MPLVGKGGEAAGTSKLGQAVQATSVIICPPPRQGVGCSEEPFIATTGGHLPMATAFLNTARLGTILLFGDTQQLLMFWTGEFFMVLTSCALYDIHSIPPLDSLGPGSTDTHHNNQNCFQTSEEQNYPCLRITEGICFREGQPLAQEVPN